VDWTQAQDRSRCQWSCECSNKTIGFVNGGEFIHQLSDYQLPKNDSTRSELSSGIYCRVKLLSTDVSEVRTASIIRDE
jgi:hypothetical protein